MQILHSEYLKYLYIGLGFISTASISQCFFYSHMNDCLSGLEVNGKQYCLPALWMFVFHPFLGCNNVSQKCLLWNPVNTWNDTGECSYMHVVFLIYFCYAVCIESCVRLRSIWSLQFYCSLIHEHSAPNHICISAYQSNGYADVYVCVLCSVYNRLKHLMAVFGVSCSRGK